MAVPILQNERKFTAWSARKNNPFRETVTLGLFKEKELFNDIRKDKNFCLIINYKERKKSPSHGCLFFL